MAERISQNLSVLDQPGVLKHLFHPRKEDRFRPTKDNREDLMIPVGEGIFLGASFHFLRTDAPVILFFHGNGEIVSDYDDFGCLFNESGLNFLVVDYRGYGKSTGTPSVTAMMKDCQAIFDFVLAFRLHHKLAGPFCVMGRSLGSASAIELCATRANQFDCLVIESGFAWVSPLLQKLGVDPRGIGFTEHKGFENIEKIKLFSKSCLVIHAQFDHIIPFSDGQALFEACGSKKKTLLEIKGANHNDLFLRGREAYLENIKKSCCQ